ncbi:MAG: hypothetical protein JXR70_09505 [Spirochaetales bacterium]|nr:hypothetical protein [Spirochaetales bacterium]
MNRKKIEELLKILDENKEHWLKAINSSREMVLSNLAMLSQEPSETFEEENRAALVLERFIASGIFEPQTDEVSNVIGIIPGKHEESNILLFSHMDHQQSMSEIDRSISISKDRVTGYGVSEDNIALSILITLPDILQRLDISYNSNIVLLAASRHHGRGDLEGIRKYVRQHKNKTDFCINLVGTPLGTVNYFSLSRVRCDINCTIDAEPHNPWGKNTNISANLVINDIMNRLFSIPLPRQPKTVINLGMITGGNRYSTVSTQAQIKLEVLSENDEIMEKVIDQIHDGCVDISAKYGVEVTSDFFGRHKAGGVSYSHPLVKSAVGIVKNLGYRPLMTYNDSALAVPLSASIPSIGIGMTTGMLSSGSKGYIDISPMPTGILQLIMLLYAIDKGYCYE